jgi:predicted alpha/beta-hydrolase family hydrolase
VIATLRDGPDGAATTVVLAPGAGAGMAHPFLAAVAHGLAAAGLAVVRMDFPYRTAGKRAPDAMPVLQQAMRDVVRDHCGERPFVLMGKSMGGRVATMVADELQARAVVVFGYPFHPAGEPAKTRTAHLAALFTPTLILQGERDELGNRADVAGYTLSPALEIAWFADGDHSLVPRASSGFTKQQHFATALERAIAFVREHATIRGS